MAGDDTNSCPCLEPLDYLCHCLTVLNLSLHVCSRSPEMPAPFAGDCVTGLDQSVKESGGSPCVDESMRLTSKESLSSGGASATTCLGTPPRPTRLPGMRLGNARVCVTDDTDSVVLGSSDGNELRDSHSFFMKRKAAVAAIGTEMAGEGKISDMATSGAGRRVLTEKGAMAEDGELRDKPLHAAEGVDSELYFDTVLNCYFDKATNKYYGLR